MFTILAFLIYLVAVCFPAYLLYHFGAQSWFWHVLSIMSGLAIGLVPTPPAWKRPELDLIIGFTFVSVMTWGIGGLVGSLRHRMKPA